MIQDVIIEEITGFTPTINYKSHQNAADHGSIKFKQGLRR